MIGMNIFYDIALRTEFNVCKVIDGYNNNS